MTPRPRNRVPSLPAKLLYWALMLLVSSASLLLSGRGAPVIVLAAMPGGAPRLGQTVAPQIAFGRDSADLGGQVQFWVSGVYRCTGSLIGVGWVLTAAHCVNGGIRSPPATALNTTIYIGDRAIQQGERHTVPIFI